MDLKMYNNVTYCGMCADLIHIGHINIINEAQKLGLPLMIGLLTDEAICSYKNPPLITFEQRELIIKHIKGVDQVVPQNTLDYTENLLKYKPKYVVHGDDWLTGIQKQTRDSVYSTLETYGGTIIDVPYTKDISSSKIKYEKWIEDWKLTIPP